MKQLSDMAETLLALGHGVTRELGTVGRVHVIYAGNVGPAQALGALMELPIS